MKSPEVRVMKLSSMRLPADLAVRYRHSDEHHALRILRHLSGTKRPPPLLDLHVSPQSVHLPRELLHEHVTAPSARLLLTKRVPNIFTTLEPDLQPLYAGILEIRPRIFERRTGNRYL